MNNKKNNAYEDACFLIKVLEQEGHKARLVGGCVRDRLLEIEPKDYDIATNALPSECLGVLQKAKIKVIPTALSHGTVTAVLPSGSIELTTLREDVETDGRRAKVKFGDSFEVDAQRRDFTINSLSQDLNGKVYDYFEGQKHLKEKKLVFVGDPEKRILEDYLRILRLYRFKSRLNFTFEEKVQDIIIQTKDGLTKISQERMTNEMEQILNGRYAVSTLEAMASVDLWEYLFPFTKSYKLKKNHEIVRKTLNYCDIVVREQQEDRHILILAALLVISSKNLSDKDLSSKVEGGCRQLKMSLVNIDKIKTLVIGFFSLQLTLKEQADVLLFIKFCDKKKDPNFFIEVCTKFWLDLCQVIDVDPSVKSKIVEYSKSYKKNKERMKAKLALTTKEIIKLLNIKEGPKLGFILDKLTRAYLNGEVTSKEEMKKYLLLNYKN